MTNIIIGRNILANGRIRYELLRAIEQHCAIECIVKAMLQLTFSQSVCLGVEFTLELVTDVTFL
jgi:hypothetical protein